MVEAEAGIDCVGLETPGASIVMVGGAGIAEAIFWTEEESQGIEDGGGVCMEVVWDLTVTEAASRVSQS